MAISAMAIFRFPVEIGESDERDSMVRPRFEERVNNKFWVIVE